MNELEMKICKDCKFYKPVSGLIYTFKDECEHPNNIAVHMVTGKKTILNSPIHNRNRDILCGKDGAWFEVKIKYPRWE